MMIKPTGKARGASGHRGAAAEVCVGRSLTHQCEPTKRSGCTSVAKEALQVSGFLAVAHAGSKLGDPAHVNLIGRLA